MRKKRICIFLCFILCISIVFGGCDSEKQSKNNEQVLKVGIGTDINTWDIVNFPDGDARFVWAQIYDTLVRLDSDLNMVPGLAESWEPEDNGKVWIFHLRKNIKFHDGTPFNAEAVVYSYSDRAYVTKTNTLQLENVEAIDENTVKFTCARPMPLPTYLTHIAWPIVSPSSVDSAGEFKDPIGTGPFKLVDYVKEQKIVLEKNENYWGDDVKLDKVIFNIIPDASARVMALSSGDVDMIIKVPESSVAKLEKDKDITVNRKLTTFTDFLQFNCKNSPFDDLNVRKAVAYAVDTKSIVSNILDNIGIAAQGRLYSPNMMYSCEDLPLYNVDQEKAKSLLAESGWKDENGDGIVEKNGKNLEVSLLVGQSWSPREKRIAEACQAQLGEVGFDVKVKQLESAALSELEKKGDFDMLMRTGYFVWGPYPHHVKVHFSKNFASHYNNSAYDELVLKGESTNDEAQKKQIYGDIQKLVLEDLPAFYIVHEEKIVATRSNVKGYKISAEDPWLELKGITIE
ncbi:ABC transporter substrate-binding protein [Anaerovorax odorimutans]|uniref:ABC transporter substrate-binding protein n=1 Tax=Anaerovorax odorimutans TaxID=109327 RepID=UPI000409B6A6|nr:ABC transporter substrate-binding protein [Anaerovorax odorimutans]